MKSNEIILSDFNNDDVPEFTFFYNNYNLIKCIHFDGRNKTIAKKETKEIKLPADTDRFNKIIYKGFFYSSLNQF